MKAILLPPVPALLSAYSGRTDPVAELRSACRQAAAWLGAARVVCDPVDEAARQRGVRVPLGVRIVESLGIEIDPTSNDLVVVASGSAMRTEKAPGHFDPRAEQFDAAIDAAIRTGQGFDQIDHLLGDLLLAQGLRGLASLPDRSRVQVDYADAPYGVTYWVARFET